MDHFYEDTDKTPEQVQATLKARAEAPPLPVRLANNDEKVIRLEVTGSALASWSEEEIDNFLDVLGNKSNNTVTTVHLSGSGLDTIFPEERLDELLEGVCSIPSLEELFIFRGDSACLSQKRLATHISKAKMLKVLMMWGYRTFDPVFCGAVRNLGNLERNTVTLPKGVAWSSLDVYCMGLAQHQKLKCFSLRCGSHHNGDAVVSPDALTVLLQSRSIESLYLDNCGLTDDHTDVLAAELKINTTLKLLDIKSNDFSDDALFSMASMLPQNKTLQNLDVSGAYITDAAGERLAKSMKQNSTLFYLELEGVAERYADEFSIPEGSENKEWFQAIDFQIRLNRAGFRDKLERKDFVESLNSVSDHLGCLFHILRRHLPHHAPRKE